jgi:hypothetical protein
MCSGTSRRHQNLTDLLDQVDDNGFLGRAISEGQFASGGTTYFNTAFARELSTAPRWTEYNLGRQWSTLSTEFAFDDDRSSVTSNVRFRVLGDGAVLTESTLTFGQTMPVEVDVSGVLRLRFEVTRVGSESAGYPGFLDPKLSR